MTSGATETSEGCTVESSPLSFNFQRSDNMSDNKDDRYEIPYSPFKIASNRIMMAKNCTVQMRTIFNRISKIHRKVLNGNLEEEIALLEKEAAELEIASKELSKAVSDMRKVRL